ncbi:MAG: pilus assembly protein PilM [Planctomycetota bacterium]
MSFKHLFHSSREVFGLDVGSSYVKAVQLHKDKKGYSVVKAGWMEIARDVINDKVDIKEAVSAIRKCVKSAQIKTKYAVCGIHGPNVALRRFRFPAMEAEQVEAAVSSEAEQVCPFEAGQYIIDYQLCNNGTAGMSDAGNAEAGREVRGILAAATLDIVGRKNQLAKAASLNCVLMDVDGLALLNCLLESQSHNPKDKTAIICIGSKFTNFAALDASGVPFVRDIPHAADEIINSLAAGHNVSSQAMRDILSGPPDKDIADFQSNMEKACSKLTGDITQTLRYYSIEGGQKIEKILVCGGFAQTKGFIKFLNKKLAAETVLWNPFDEMRFNCNPQSADFLKKHGSGFALAAGLAMRTI